MPQTVLVLTHKMIIVAVMYHKLIASHRVNLIVLQKVNAIITRKHILKNALPQQKQNARQNRRLTNGANHNKNVIIDPFILIVCKKYIKGAKNALDFSLISS